MSKKPLSGITTVQAIHDLANSFGRVTERSRLATRIVKVNSTIVVLLPGNKWFSPDVDGILVKNGHMRRLSRHGANHTYADIIQVLIQFGFISWSDARQYVEEARAYRIANARRWVIANNIKTAAKRLDVKLPKAFLAKLDEATKGK